MRYRLHDRVEAFANLIVDALGWFSFGFGRELSLLGRGIERRMYRIAQGQQQSLRTYAEHHGRTEIGGTAEAIERFREIQNESGLDLRHLGSKALDVLSRVIWSELA